MALRIKRTGQRVCPTLPTVKRQAATVVHTVSVIRHKARMTKEEINDVRAWIHETAFGARVAEKTGMLRRDVVSILTHANP